MAHLSSQRDEIAWSDEAFSKQILGGPLPKSWLAWHLERITPLQETLPATIRLKDERALSEDERDESAMKEQPDRQTVISLGLKGHCLHGDDHCKGRNEAGTYNVFRTDK